MPILVADCPRCRAGHVTFDVQSHVYIGEQHSWQTYYEIFSVCRICGRPTIFLVSQTAYQDELMFSNNPNAIMTVVGGLNRLFSVERYISLRDESTTVPPEHLPTEIDSSFMEGAACFDIGCYNAAGTMFRLCIDQATRPLLPDPNNGSVPQPKKNQRWQLGHRLNWLFDQGILPSSLRELAGCIREDGNDGAHIGTLTKEDAEDIMDFTVAFLERLITEPKKLELAEKRRQQRRSPTQSV